MIVLILLCILLIAVLSCALVFVLCILLPALSQQQAVDTNPVFAADEIDNVTTETGFISSPIESQAVVLCSNERQFPDGKRMEYNGLKDCALFKSIYETENDCKWGCTGFGSCINSCPQNAIKIVNNTAVISEMCNGCGLCVDQCPYHLITLIPVKTEYIIPCVSRDGNYSVCSQSCNGCNECNDKKGILQMYDNNEIIPALPNTENVAKADGKCKNKCLKKYEPVSDSSYKYWSKLRKLLLHKHEKSISIIWE